MTQNISPTAVIYWPDPQCEVVWFKFSPPEYVKTFAPLLKQEAGAELFVNPTPYQRKKWSHFCYCQQKENSRLLLAKIATCVKNLTPPG